MSITSILSVLVSLAMMLTGTYGSDQPEALAARTLNISDVRFSVNGEETVVTPELSLGVMTENGNAVFDFSIPYGDDELLPLQLCVNEEEATLLFVETGTAFSLSSEELSMLTAMLGIDTSMLSADPMDMLIDAMGLSDAEAEQFRFIMTEFMPAYIDLIELTMDDTRLEALNASANEAMLAVMDFGEGVPGKATYEGVEYDVTTYECSLDTDDVLSMVDAAYAADEALDNFVKAYVKLINMTAEGTDLTIEGVESFSDLVRWMNMEFRYDIVERFTDDGLHGDVESVLTCTADFSELLGAAPGTYVLDPIVVTTNAYVAGERITTTQTMEMAQEGVAMNMTVNSEQEGASYSTDLSMEIAPESVEETSAATTSGLAPAPTQAPAGSLTSYVGTEPDPDFEPVSLTMSIDGVEATETSIGNYNATMNMTAGDTNIVMTLIGSENPMTGTSNYSLVANAVEDGVNMVMTLTGRDNPGTGESDFVFSLNAADEITSVSLSLEGGTDAAGNFAMDVVANMADAYDGSFDLAFRIGLSVEPFENMTEGAQVIEADIFAGSTEHYLNLIGELLKAIAPYATDLETLMEDEFVSTWLTDFLSVNFYGYYLDDYGISTLEDGDLPLDAPSFNYLSESYSALSA